MDPGILTYVTAVALHEYAAPRHVFRIKQRQYQIDAGLVKSHEKLGYYSRRRGQARPKPKGALKAYLNATQGIMAQAPSQKVFEFDAIPALFSTTCCIPDIVCAFYFRVHVGSNTSSVFCPSASCGTDLGRKLDV